MTTMDDILKEIRKKERNEQLKEHAPETRKELLEEYLVTSFVQWLHATQNLQKDVKRNEQTMPAYFESYLCGIAHGIELVNVDSKRRKNLLFDWSLDVDMDQVTKRILEKFDCFQQSESRETL